MERCYSISCTCFSETSVAYGLPVVSSHTFVLCIDAHINISVAALIDDGFFCQREAESGLCQVLSSSTGAIWPVDDVSHNFLPILFFVKSSSRQVG